MAHPGARLFGVKPKTFRLVRMRIQATHWYFNDPSSIMDVCPMNLV